MRMILNRIPKILDIELKAKTFMWEKETDLCIERQVMICTYVTFLILTKVIWQKKKKENISLSMKTKNEPNLVAEIKGSMEIVSRKNVIDLLLYESSCPF